VRLENGGSWTAKGEPVRIDHITAFVLATNADNLTLFTADLSRTHLINRKWVRWLLVTGWQGATKEHSRQRSVTEEQRSQPVIRSQPSGLPIFATTASLFVSQRSLRIFSFLTPRGGGKSLATHPFPIYEMGSSVRGLGHAPSAIAAQAGARLYKPQQRP
jgi:hypothetical protein